MSSTNPSTLSGVFNSTVAGTGGGAKTGSTTPAPPDDLLGTSGGHVIVALLVLILLVLVALPILTYVVGKRCWVKVHDPERGKWNTGDMHRKVENIDNDKCVQTDIIGLEFDEFFKRRRPIDMSKYHGKPYGDVEEPYPRWYRINPAEWSDPWAMRHAGKETNYINVNVNKDNYVY